MDDKEKLEKIRDLYSAQEKLREEIEKSHSSIRNLWSIVGSTFGAHGVAENVLRRKESISDVSNIIELSEQFLSNKEELDALLSEKDR